VRRLALLLACLPLAAHATEDADLDLIPSAADEAPATAPAAEGPWRHKLVLELAPQAHAWRDDMDVPPPPGPRPDYSNRASLDARIEAQLGDGFSLTLADRLDHFSREGETPDLDGLRNTLKEAYATWSGGDRYADLGRINLRNGVALGFNPVDWFKQGAVVTRISEDPTVLRENRLGTVMMRGQAVWEGGAATLALAPQLREDPGRPDDSGFALGLDRTNRSDRALFKLSQTLAEDFAPEAYLFLEDGEAPQFGLSIGRTLADWLVAYGEWSGGRRPSLAARALAEARRTGTLPAFAPAALPIDGASAFRSQLALGLAATTDFNLTINLEWHFNQGGLSGADWDAWQRAGRASPAAGRQFWLVRSHAVEAQEPLFRHSLFLRAVWSDALLDDLDLTALARVNPGDGSFFAQMETAYHLTGDTSVALTVGGNVGAGDSEFGGLAQERMVQVKLARYF